MTTQDLKEMATKHHENVRYEILCDAKDHMRVYRYWSYSIEKKMLLDLDTQEKKYKKIIEDIEENK
jgi:hypothetical protein